MRTLFPDADDRLTRDLRHPHRVARNEGNSLRQGFTDRQSGADAAGVCNTNPQLHFQQVKERSSGLGGQAIIPAQRHLQIPAADLSSLPSASRGTPPSAFSGPRRFALARRQKADDVSGCPVCSEGGAEARPPSWRSISAICPQALRPLSVRSKSRYPVIPIVGIRTAGLRHRELARGIRGRFLRFRISDSAPIALKSLRTWSAVRSSPVVYAQSHDCLRPAIRSNGICGRFHKGPRRPSDKVAGARRFLPPQLPYPKPGGFPNGSPVSPVRIDLDPKP